MRKMTSDSNPFMIREALKILVDLGGVSDLPILEAGIARLPGKWTHKVAHNWRRKLAPPKEASKNPAVKGLEKRLKRIQKQIDRLNRKRKK
ncbi:MAG TPA: hypothetical protein EYN66_04075 [Myxococcales bacterium]|nr:hypothetical protein [Myxococcales bacterium]